MTPQVAPVVGTPISSSAQAYFTSSCSRLRTGATLLVQPTLFPARPTRASHRSQGTVINYAEVDDKGDDDDGEGEGDDAKKDGDHIPDAGALDDDVLDRDFVGGAGSGRRVGRPSKQQQQSYLGQSRGFLSNAATAQGGPMFALDYGPNYLSSLPLPSTPPPHPIPNPILIPVRLEFDVPELGLRIRDVFLWNLHEPSVSWITPEVFAAQFCRDLDIGVDPYGEIVTRQIRAQVEDARGEAWVGWMDSLSVLVEDDNDDNDEDLNLDLSLNQHQDSPSPTKNTNPECRLCADLGLSGEAIPLIAHAVHEELCRHRRDVVDGGVLGAHPPLNLIPGNGGSVGDSEGPMKDRTGLGLGSLGRPAWRDWAEVEEYATRWEVLSPEEVEWREVERERAGRRLRRETSKWRSRR
ncbi:hypothetical protein GG344DRAFT_90856 [Lentinula edodes]|nr:hypothetical protein GG344DRAFT_90856 [Lentinula edodes]